MQCAICTTASRGRECGTEGTFDGGNFEGGGKEKEMKGGSWRMGEGERGRLIGMQVDR